MQAKATSAKKTAPKGKAASVTKKSAARKRAAKSETTEQQAAGKFSTEVVLRHVRISPRKARLVVDLIRGKQVEPALQILQFSSKKAAAMCGKLIRSAVASAKDRGGIDIDDLWVLAAKVDMGRVMKRFMPRAQGRATPIRKRSAHISLKVGQR